MKIKIKRKRKKTLSFDTCVTLGVPKTPQNRAKYNTLKDQEILAFIFEYTTDEDLK